MNFDIPSENDLTRKYFGQSPKVTISQGREKWIPENVPVEFRFMYLLNLQFVNLVKLHSQV